MLCETIFSTKHQNHLTLPSSFIPLKGIRYFYKIIVPQAKKIENHDNV